MAMIKQQLRNSSTYISGAAGHKNSQWTFLPVSILTFPRAGGRGQPADFKPTSDWKGNRDVDLRKKLRRRR
jgi:hypothetical protein